MPDEKGQRDAEETMRRFFPDAYKEQDEAEAKIKELFFPKCHACGAKLNRKLIRDSMYHLAATYYCEECGDENYV